jgi:hypothetical protein
MTHLALAWVAAAIVVILVVAWLNRDHRMKAALVAIIVIFVMIVVVFPLLALWLSTHAPSA